MKKEILYIIIALIIGISYSSVEITKIVYKEKVRQENLKIEEEQKEIYGLCVDYASKKSLYLSQKVPSMYDEIEKDEIRDKKECFEKYKSKLFRIEEKEIFKRLLESVENQKSNDPLGIRN